MTAEVESGPVPALEERVRAALSTVIDPEIDEPITDLGFVASVDVAVGGMDGDVRVDLRLPTFYCAPNFTFLMVADAHDAVREVEGVRSVSVVLADHHVADEINAGVAAGSDFESVFGAETTDGLAEVRRTFLSKAAIAGQDRVARPLVDAGATPSDLVATTLGSLPDTPDARRLRHRRTLLGLPAGDDAPLLVDAAGHPVPEAQVPLHLRRARLARIGMELNGHQCMDLLKVRYAQ